MSIWETVKLAIQAVRSNLLRAILTLMIIAFGIMALVGILTAIDSAIYSLNDNFARLGANSFSIRPAGGRVGGKRDGQRQKAGDPISLKQALEFKERFKYPAQMTTFFWCSGQATVNANNKKTDPNVALLAIDENYSIVKTTEIEFGRNFTAKEALNGAYKALVGRDIVKKLFKDKPEQAMSKTIAIGSTKYKIIGIMKAKGSSMGGSEDNRVYIPLKNGKNQYSSQRTNFYMDIAVQDATTVENAIASATGLFRGIRGLKAAEDNDFYIRKSDSLIENIKEETSNLRISAVVIGLITLLGAAIGLMNIMLVSVTERTREIGVCKALGANQKTIMLQFLAEAVVICQMGGIVGTFLGVLIGVGVSHAMGGNFVMPWAWIILAIIVCLVVGLISGLYPAMKASRLDPIEALRYQ